jgi:hypothetical protein
MSDEWRQLEAGEIIQEGDETDACVNPWKDMPVWRPVSEKSVGDAAPDPQYPAHRIYRRRAKK